LVLHIQQTKTTTKTKINGKKRGVKKVICKLPKFHVIKVVEICSGACLVLHEEVDDFDAYCVEGCQGDEVPEK
jgi:hypothetical protein